MADSTTLRDYTTRLNPKDAGLFHNRGILYRDKGDYDWAIVDFDEAIRLNPKNARAFSGRGVLCGYKEDFDCAIADFSEAFRLDQKCGSPWFTQQGIGSSRRPRGRPHGREDRRRGQRRL
jgi:Flp pilus assembly protein TadD